ncbi:glycosyltransferase family 2 protein [Desulfococcaceae bacterium HSG9]|nr:glycosyltransferase family 2 protein [Desulfococcaceae bacterium HSG9]
MADDFQLVTVIMPIRNEAEYIERSMRSVLTQDYPSDQMEVLVADGMSDDGTRAIVSKIINDNKQIPIKLIDNPAQTVPPALNMGLRYAQGQIIILIGGHCEITSDYVSKCVKALQSTGTDCTGGTIITIGETVTAQAIALAQSSFFGVGGVAFRIGQAKPGYVDTLAFGAYRRNVFKRIGHFDEDLVRNQDDEFNFRLIQAGGKIWLDPSIQSVYYSRASLIKLGSQYFQYGFYKVRVMQKRRGVPSWRHLVPGIFVLTFAAAILISMITTDLFWFLAIAGPYCLANLIASFWTGRKKMRLLPLLPLAFTTLHFSYGSGFIWGIWRFRKNFRETEILKNNGR